MVYGYKVFNDYATVQFWMVSQYLARLSFRAWKIQPMSPDGISVGPAEQKARVA